jgi:hypothetical protein
LLYDLAVLKKYKPRFILHTIKLSLFTKTTFPYSSEKKTMTNYLIAALLAFSITPIANASDEEQSCREELGKKEAAIYVNQCLEISPATHPPCNDQNACSLIIDEIKRGCEFAKKTEGADVPKFCD